MLAPSTRVDCGLSTTKAREKGARHDHYHPSFQQISFLDQETGECGDRELNHSEGDAERFYRELKQRGANVRVGMEATGHARWFDRLLAELGFEVWIGDATEIKRQRGRKQKTDREDGRLLLRLLLENRFPRIWTPNPENRDLRQLLWHRHRLVQMRTRITGLRKPALERSEIFPRAIRAPSGAGLPAGATSSRIDHSGPRSVAHEFAQHSQ